MSKANRLDFPELGIPTIPISAMTLSCNQIQKLSPLFPFVFFLGARFVELLNRTFPNPPLPPFAIIIFCSDLIPLKSHLKIPWIMGYDLNASLTMKEKKSFLERAAKENWILFFYHDPETVAVKIKQDNKENFYYKQN